MPFNLPGGTIKFEESKTNGRHVAVSASGGGASGGGALQGATFEPGFSATDNGDGTITINDAQNRFGTKPGGAGPVLAYQFGKTGNYTRHSASRYSGNVTFHPSAAVINNSEGYNGASYAAEYQTATTPWLHFYDAILNVSRTTPEPYLWLRRRFNWTASEADALSDSWNWKHARFLSAEDKASQPGLGVLDGQATSSNIRYQYRKGTASANTIYEGTINTDDKLWHIEEYLITANAIESWFDGNKGANISIDDWTGNFSHVMLFRDQDVPVSGAACYVDQLVYEDSPCEIYLADRATYADDAAYSKEIQINTAWSSGSVTFEKNSGGLSFGSGQSIYVRKADKTVLRIGGW